MDDDHELVKRTLRGDTAAYELLMRRHAAALWRVARSIVPDDGTAEEAVQDAFLRAHRSLGSFRGDAAVKTWLVAICHRTSLNLLRRRRMVVIPIDSVRLRAAQGVDMELRSELRRAMNTLAAVEQQAFTLVDVLGYSRDEAATIVGVPASTMRSRVARARARLADTVRRGQSEERHV